MKIRFVSAAFIISARTFMALVLIGLLASGCGGGGGDAGSSTGNGSNTGNGSGSGNGSSNGNTGSSETGTPTLTEFVGNMGGGGTRDGIGAGARFNGPQGVSVDGAGQVYVADGGSHTIRKITAAGAVTTLAGQAYNPGSADGTGSAARFGSVDSRFQFGRMSTATDSLGNVYVADTENSTIRKITPAGVVTTLAGTANVRGSSDGVGVAASFYSPQGIATDSAGNVYVADTHNNTIRKITPVGVVTTLAGTAGGQGHADGTGAAASFNNPTGIASDPTGNVYVADSWNNIIRKITSSGTVTTLAGTAGVQGHADGTGAAAAFLGPIGVATDNAGNAYVADQYNGTIRKVTPAGVVTTLAGTASVFGSADATGAEARFSSPYGIATDSMANVYVADSFTIRKITSAGVVTTLAGAAYASGNADGTGTAATFVQPQGIATDSMGNVYVTDSGYNSIRKVTRAGVVTTLAGAWQAGSADGTGAAARFKNPHGIAADGDGNVYVADTDNYTIRKITPAGVVTTLAGKAGEAGNADGIGSTARFGSSYWRHPGGPRGVATDRAGNVYVADTGNSTIRKISPSGLVTTLAASFASPEGIAVDNAGNIYVSDGLSGDISKIAPSGVATSLAGTKVLRASGTPSVGIATDNTGNIYASDPYNNSIRKITPDGVVGAVVGWPGPTEFAPGVLSGGLLSPRGIAISGRSLYISMLQGIAVVTNLP